MKRQLLFRKHVVKRLLTIAGLLLLLGTIKTATAQEGQYIGEIRMFAGNFAPPGWALCEGQLLPISQNQALFSIIGNAYGGNGTTTFALPDLRARFPLGAGNANGNNVQTGEQGGSNTVTILSSNLPPHTHFIGVSTEEGNTDNPQNATLAVGATPDLYKVKSFTTNPPNATLSANSVTPSSGATIPISVMPPYQAVSYIICLNGIYPSRQ